MMIQIQTKRLGMGFNQQWQVYGQWRGYRLPKYAVKEYREIRRQGLEDARIVTSKEGEFIKAA